jgi:hypothetical protein
MWSLDKITTQPNIFISPPGKFHTNAEVKKFLRRAPQEAARFLLIASC